MIDKFKRNINQLERKGTDARFYFIDKSIEEAIEWIEALRQYRECLKHDKVEGTTFEKNLELETSDVMNCIIYLSELKLINIDRVQEYADVKQDIGFEKEGGNLLTYCNKCGGGKLYRNNIWLCPRCEPKKYLKYLQKENKLKKENENK